MCKSKLQCSTLKDTSEHCPPWYHGCIIHGSDPNFCEFVELDQNFLCADMYGSFVYNKKVLCIQHPYWRRFLTCKWNLSFFICEQPENNMRLSHNILVLHLEIWWFISNEPQLCSVLLLILKDFCILTYLHDRSSKSNSVLFGKNLNVKIFKVVRKTFKKDLSCTKSVFFTNLTTLFKL